MRLPFTREQFFEIFAQYNIAVWPIQPLLVLLAVGCVVWCTVAQNRSRLIGWALSAMWAWMAVVYHFAFFSRINPAAWLFGAGFLLAAWKFIRHANASTLCFERPQRMEHALGIVLISYALIGYPVVGSLAGQNYPHMPTFGVPCPTTIFTFGMLLLAARPVPVSLFVIPMIWSAIATVAALQLGVVEDFGLPIAAGLVLFTVTVRSSRVGGRKQADGAALSR